MKTKLFFTATLFVFFAIQSAAAQSGYVGAVPGQFAVGASGAATYSIPIEVPEGINGIQPNISLVYNSQSGNGVAGWGWGISGLSAVTKGAKNIFSDDAVSGIDLTEKSDYYLDGNKLLVKSGFTYGASGSQYETENKTYAKITVSAVTNNYPSAFTVTNKDGLTMTYSKAVRPQNTAYAVQWLLTRVGDINGNFMNYVYMNSVGGTQTVLEYIEYGSNTSATPPLKIQFNYTIKNYRQKQYITGYYLEDYYLLQNITINANGSQVLKYELTHTYRDQKHFLEKIKLIGKNNESMPETVFEYGADNNVTSTDDLYAGQTPSTIVRHLFFSGDVDGDGISDLLELYTRNNPYTSSLNDYVTAYRTIYENGSFRFGDPLFSVHTGYTWNDENFYKVVNGNGLLADLTGSNKKTLIVPAYISDNGYGQKITRFTDVLNNISYHYFDVNLSYSSEIPAYAIADFNNDGKDEIVYIEKYNTSTNVSSFPGKILYFPYGCISTNNIYESIGDGVVRSNLFQNSNINSIGKIKDIFISDFNSDGLLDILIAGASQYCFLKNNGGVKGSDGIVRVSFTQVFGDYSNLKLDNDLQDIKPGDFNGDGLMDFVRYDGNNDFQMYINTGNFGFTEYSLSNITMWEDRFNKADYCDRNDKRDDFIVTDFNHDGKSDIIVVDANYENVCRWYVPLIIPCGAPYMGYVNTSVKWYASNGTSFTKTKDFTLTDEDYHFKGYATTGDFDGDGKEDLFCYGGKLYRNLTRIAGKGTFYNQFNTDFAGNLLKEITDGTGNKTSVHYQPLTYPIKQNSPEDVTEYYYQKGTAAAYPVVDIQAPLYCVSSVSDPISTTEYCYKNLQGSVNGKGLLGFMEINTSNEILNRKVTTTTEMDYTLFLPKKTVTTTETFAFMYEHLISKVTDSIANSKSGKIYTSFPKKHIEKDFLTMLEKTTEYLAYDTYGNFTKLKTTQGDQTVTAETEYGQFGNWAWGANKPTLVTTTYKQAGDSVVRKKSFTYHAANGYLLTEIIDPEDDNKVTTAYSNFDVFGHPRKVSTTARVFGSNRQWADVTRYAETTYIPSGRFVKTTKNALGETTTYYWDEVFCKLDSVSDHYGHSTKYTYDDFGKRTKTLYPDGNQEETSMYWETGTNSLGSKYYSVTTASGAVNNSVITKYDALGRELQTQTTAFDGKTVLQNTEYNSKGQLYRVSEPYFSNETKKWAATYLYDDYGRTKKVTTPMGDTEYDYSEQLTTIVTTPEGETKTTLNLAGQTARVETNGKGVAYTYYPNGLTKTSKPDGAQAGQELTMEYDLQGNRTELKDPDAGVVESKYDGWGQLTYTRQKVHNASDWVTGNYYYLNDGRLNYRQTAGNETVLVSYAYDSRNRISSIEIPRLASIVDEIVVGERPSIDITTPVMQRAAPAISRPDIGIAQPRPTALHKQTFTYDGFDRVLNIREEIDGKTINRSTSYDTYGRVDKETYPSGYRTQNHYDSYGNLQKITDSSNRNVWELKEKNAKGQTVKEKKGTVETVFGYDDLGRTTAIKAGNIMDWEYFYTPEGNLDKRVDKLTDQMELCVYDNLNRLTGWGFTNVHEGYEDWNYIDNYIDMWEDHKYSISYNSQGNITQKTDIFPEYRQYPVFTYGAAGKPHALQSISNIDYGDMFSILPATNMVVEYTDFKKVKRIVERDLGYNGEIISVDDNDSEVFQSDIRFTYGVDEQRRKMQSWNGNNAGNSTYYFGDYEEICASNGTILKKIHYLRGAVLIQNSNGTSEFYYTYADILGSLTALARENGTVEQRYAYSPWGRRLNPYDWREPLDVWNANLKLTRGYTGHEHIDQFGIINMNGRIYDPYTAQFYSPDPYIQDGGNWLNYNRYSYCLGNPFKYTDPDGNWWFYIYPNISFGKNGIESIGISAGIGFNKILSAGINIGYNFQGDSWTFTGNAGIAGVNIYGGYDTKAGWIGGVGYGFGGYGQSAWNVSTNVTSLGIGYSQNGGWNANAFGIQAGRNGIEINPSFGASLNLYYGSVNCYYYDGSSVVDMKDSSIKSNAEAEAALAKVGHGSGKHGVRKVYYEGLPANENGVERSATGRLYELDKKGRRTGRQPNGMAKIRFKGTKVIADVIIAPHVSVEGFYITYDHELIHIYHANKYYDTYNADDYSEIAAHTFCSLYYPDTYNKNYYGSRSLLDVPDYLIGIPLSVPMSTVTQSFRYITILSDGSVVYVK